MMGNITAMLTCWVKSIPGGFQTMFANQLSLCELESLYTDVNYANLCVHIQCPYAGVVAVKIYTNNTKG